MGTKRKLIFMTWNTNGLKTKTKKVKTEIKKSKCDVAFIQETHIGPKGKRVFDDFDGSKSFFTIYNSIQKGVAILIKKDIFDESSYTEKDVNGCYIVVKCTLQGRLFTLVSVYNPQADPSPLFKLKDVIEKISDGILVIGGDFNIALNPYLDRTAKTINKYHTHFKPVIHRFMTSFHLVDVWRRFYPTDKQFTYEQNDVKSRLDYFLVPEESMQYIKTCKIIEEKCCSDHQPVLLEIKMPDQQNPEISQDITDEQNSKIFNFIHSVSCKWLSHKKEYFPDLDLKKNPDTPLMISAKEIASAIQSLTVNQKHVTRLDGLPISFYVENSYVLIPYLCAFYHNLLKNTMNIPQSFSDSLKASDTHSLYNADYLILATILARCLSEHLESHSIDYRDRGKNTAVLFTFRERTAKIRWSDLRSFLAKELDRTKTDPPLCAKLHIDILYRVLRNSKSGKYKLLHWGCPMTPVLMTLCLKHVANELTVRVKDRTSKIFISRENVIARFSSSFDSDVKHSCTDLKKKYANVDCRVVK